MLGKRSLLMYMPDDADASVLGRARNAATPETHRRAAGERRRPRRLVLGGYGRMRAIGREAPIRRLMLDALEHSSATRLAHHEEVGSVRLDDERRRLRRLVSSGLVAHEVTVSLTGDHGSDAVTRDAYRDDLPHDDRSWMSTSARGAVCGASCTKETDDALTLGRGERRR